MSYGSFFRSQVDTLEVTAGGAAADGGKQDEQQRPCCQDDKLHPVAAGLGVHARHTGEVMERFRDGDGEKPDDAVADERPAEPVGGAEKPAEKDGIKEGKEEQKPAEIGEIGVHHGVVGVDGHFPPKGEPQGGEEGAKQPAGKLDKQAEGVFCPDDITFLQGSNAVNRISPLSRAVWKV